MKVMHGDSIEARVGALGVQVEKLERRMEENFEVVGQRFEQVDKRFEQVDKRFEQHFGQVDRRFENLEADLREHGRDTKRGLEIVADRLEKTNRMILYGAFTVTGGFMAGFAAMITLFVNQT
jgi:DNA anti-recombination protein RmuC